MAKTKYTGYELSRNWFDFCFENPDRIKPIHTALYFFAIEHCNRLGWKEKFGLPTEMTKDAIGVKSWHTYIKAFNDLIEWEFFILIERSKNQYSSNIIALSKNNEALDKAYDEALTKHVSKHQRSTHQSNDSIDKHITIEPITGNSKHIPPKIEWIKNYCLERKNNIDPNRFMNHYESNGWMVGRTKMKDWQASVRTWEKKKEEINTPPAYKPIKL